MARNLKDHILETASTLFYSHGIKATGVEAIVRAAGTTKMSLYKYFPSKDDLVIAFLRKRDEDFTTWFVEQVDGKAELSMDKLLAIFEVIGEWLESPQFRGCAFINASAEFPIENNPIQRVSADFYEKFRNYITTLARMAGAKNPHILAQQLALLIEGAIVTEQMQRESGSILIARQAAEALINLAVSR
jgi:AcrR family transcriptional regulator